MRNEWENVDTSDKNKKVFMFFFEFYNVSGFYDVYVFVYAMMGTRQVAHRFDLCIHFIAQLPWNW